MPSSMESGTMPATAPGGKADDQHQNLTEEHANTLSSALPSLTDQPKSQRKDLSSAEEQQQQNHSQKIKPKFRANYSYREANWEIGRAAEYAGVQVKKYDRNDRFAAWRKRTERRKEAMEKRMLKGAKKVGRKK